MKKLFLLLSVMILCGLAGTGTANQEKVLRSTEGEPIAGWISCDSRGGGFTFHLDGDWYACTSSSDVTLLAENAVQDWQLICTNQDDTYAVGLFDALEFDLLSATGQVSCLRRFSMEALFSVMDMGYGDVSYSLEDFAATDQALWLLMVSYDGAPPMVLRFDLADQSLQRMPLPPVEAFDRYDRERLIALTADNRLICLDEQGQWTEVETLPSGQISAFAYNDRCGTACFIQDGKVKRWRSEKGVDVVEEYARMPEGSRARGCVSDDGRYMMASSDAIYLCDPEKETAQETVTVLGWLTREMQYAYEDQYDIILQMQPGSEFLLLEDYAGRMVMRDDSFDAAVVSSAMCVLPFLQAKGYCGAVSSGDALAAKALYPPVTAYLCPQGTWTAVPVRASLDCLCVNRRLLEQLGIAEDELPTTLEAWVDWLADWHQRYPDAPAHIQPLYVGGRSLRHFLMAMLVNDYLDQHTALNHPLTFAEPFLASTVRAIEAGDESWRRLESFDASLYEEVGYVFTLMNPLRGGAAQEEWMPWPLKLTEGEEPLLTMNMTVMVVNPYGKEQEKARQLADFCAGHWDGETGLLLSAAWEGPTENRHYREEAAALNEEIALLEAKGDRDGLEAAQRELERLAPMRWDISPEQAAWYQEHAGQVRIGGGNGFLCTAKAQLGRIITAFGQGGMPWERALEELQRMAQMERMESE